MLSLQPAAAAFNFNQIESVIVREVEILFLIVFKGFINLSNLGQKVPSIIFKIKIFGTKD